MITIVNYQMGNIRSVQNALDYLGIPSRVSSSPNYIINSEKLILPGVGSFAQGMKNLMSIGLLDAMNEAVHDRKVPILGICLGMQLFADEGTEGGKVKGLGWIPGIVKHFEFEDRSVRVPHIGFNTVDFATENNTLFKNLGESADFYFVHSYHLMCPNQEYVTGRTNYHGEFVSSVQRNNIYGTQFHPEKSQSNGLIVIRNFIESNINNA